MGKEVNARRGKPHLALDNRCESGKEETSLRNTVKEESVELGD